MLTDLGVLPGGTSSFAQAINDRGDIVGFSTSANPSLHAFRWRAGVMTDLGVLPGASLSTARDINIAGVIVGESGSFNRFAVRWDPDGAISPLASVPSQATAVNDRGDVTGVVHGGTTHGFVWQQGEFTEIQAPPGSTMPFLQPFGINNQTQIVGNSSAGAFLWQGGELTLLPRLAGISSTGFDINNRGLIAGSSSVNPNGLNQHAVIWTL